MNQERCKSDFNILNETNNEYKNILSNKEERNILQQEYI